MELKENAGDTFFDFDKAEDIHKTVLKFLSLVI